MSPLLLLGLLALDLMPPMSTGSTVAPWADPVLARADALQVRGDAWELAGQVTSVVGVGAVAAGTSLLVHASMCDEVKGGVHDMSPRDVCRIAGGVTLGVGLGLGTLGVWLWYRGWDMQHEATELKRGGKPRVGLTLEPGGARAAATWRF